MKLHVTSAAAVIAAVILAVLAGSALADNGSPAPPASTVPTTSLPAVTTSAPAIAPASTTTDPADSPAPWAPPAPAEQTAPTVLPAPGVQITKVQFEWARDRIAGYTKSARHWQAVLGQKPLRPINIWALGSLERANSLLTALKKRSHRLHQAAKAVMKRRIQTDIQQVIHMDRVMGIQPPRSLASSGSLQEQYIRIQRIAQTTLNRYVRVPYESQFQCIHGGEGSWQDPNAPFWGGLQMNLGFMAHYGSYLLRTKGTADHWTPLEQMWTAAKAVPSRGFTPWPNTGRACGLIT